MLWKRSAVAIPDVEAATFRPDQMETGILQPGEKKQTKKPPDPNMGFSNFGS